MRFTLIFCFIQLSIMPIFAASIEAKKFQNSAQEARYQGLINEIRCPVCQGQSIGGSNAGLAMDLRKQVQKMIIQGNNNSEIRQFMTDRYGDFVIFKPPVNRQTYILWFAPFGFLTLTLLLFIRRFYHKPPAIQIDISKSEDLLK
ncbi:MAG: cytochrome c-type biogenesis protein CcmH [Candidatus Thioglobus sp.]|nr:cytochrome c-type biogenesis protein CcmH [Candidatus Thioglobus sp.]